MTIGKIKGCDICGTSTQGRFCKHHRRELNQRSKKQKEQKVEFLEVLKKELSKPREV